MDTYNIKGYDFNISNIKSRVDTMIHFLNSPRLVYDTDYSNIIDLVNQSLVVNNSLNYMTNSDIEKILKLTRFEILRILKRNNPKETENLKKIMQKKIPAGSETETRNRIQNLLNFYKRQFI